MQRFTEAAAPIVEGVRETVGPLASSIASDLAAGRELQARNRRDILEKTPLDERRARLSEDLELAGQTARSLLPVAFPVGMGAEIIGGAVAGSAAGRPLGEALQSSYERGPFRTVLESTPEDRTPLLRRGFMDPQPTGRTMADRLDEFSESRPVAGALIALGGEVAAGAGLEVGARRGAGMLSRTPPAHEIPPPPRPSPRRAVSSVIETPEVARETVGGLRRRGSAPNASGAVQREMVGTVGGAFAGAAAGAGLASEENRIGGAITGALVGARSGYLISRMGAKAGTTRPQLAASDPDVQAVLATSARAQAGPGMLGKARDALGAVPEVVRRAYQEILDDVYTARRFGREVGGTEELSVEASRSRGWRGWADEMVGLRKRAPGSTSTDPTLRQAIEAARGIEDDVVALTRAQRALELSRHGKAEKGVDLQAAEAAAEKLSQIPEVADAAEKLRSFYRHLLELRHRNGLLSDDAYQQIVDSGQFYVPFLRDAPELSQRSGSSGGKLFNRSAGVRRMKDGSAVAPIVDPFEQAVLDAQATARDVSRQRVFNVVARIVEQNPDRAAPFIERVSPRFLGKTEEGRVLLGAPFGKGNPVIETVVNGRRRYFKVVDDDLFDSLASISPETNRLFTRIVDLFSLPARGLRTGVTMMPSFGAANAQRDAFWTSLSYGFPGRSVAAGSAIGGATGAAVDDDDRIRGFLRGAGIGASGGVMAPHALRIANGMRHIVSNDDTYQAFLREGAAGTGFFVPDRKTARRMIQEMQSEISPADILRPRNWWDALQTVNRYVEEAPRVAKFADALESGLSPAVAAVGGREVSLDFSRGGSGTREIRKLRAFWNPMVQGLDKLRTLLNPVKNPQGFAVGLAAMTAPSIALWTVNKDDPTYWQTPLWIRNLNWMIPVGKKQDGSTRFLYVMKPFEIGIFATLPERILDYAYQRDPERLKVALGDMLGQTTGSLAPIPTAAVPVIETRMGGPGGWDSFRQRPVVDHYLQPLPAREQYNAETSSAGIGLSRLAELGSFGLLQPSPEKIDHIIEGYTGTAGRVANQALSRAARATGLDGRAESPNLARSQWARFASRPAGFSTDDVNTMFRRFERGDEHRVKHDRLVQAGDVDAAAAYYERHRDELELVAELRGHVNAFRGLAAQRRQIERDPNLSGLEKREIIAALGQQAAEIAVTAVGEPPGRGVVAAPTLARPRSRRVEGQPGADDQESRWSRNYGF